MNKTKILGGDMKDHYLQFLILLGVLVAVLFIGALKQKAEWLLNFLCRSVVGCVFIYFINMAVSSYNMEFAIGLNFVTVLTCGILGFPGLLMLYGINLIHFL